VSGSPVHFVFDVDAGATHIGCGTENSPVMTDLGQLGSRNVFIVGNPPDQSYTYTMSIEGDASCALFLDDLPVPLPPHCV
jgi:hypothetical protein